MRAVVPVLELYTNVRVNLSVLLGMLVSEYRFRPVASDVKILLITRTQANAPGFSLAETQGPPSKSV